MTYIEWQWKPLFTVSKYIPVFSFRSKQSQNNRHHGRGLKPDPPEYEAGMLKTQPQSCY
jgi:hypothetical protein